MQLNFLKTIYKWTVRIIIPVFIFTQLFIACHAAYAADQNGITITGSTVKVQIDTNVFAVNLNTETSTNKQDLITLNFEKTNVRTVLLYLAEITGDTILLDKAVSGDVTIINPKPVTTAQAKQIIFSILEMQGFTIVRYDNYVKVVRSGEAKTLPIKTLRPAKNAL